MSFLKKTPKPEGDGLTYQQRRAAAKAAAKENGGVATKPKRMSFKEERAVVKATRAERKQLRKDLRRQGVKKRSEFELFANEVGLSYPEGTTAAILAKATARGAVIARTLFATFTVWKMLATALLILGLTLYVAYVTEEKGHFTVNVTADMLENGFQISSTEDFSGNETRLYAQQLQNSNATSIYEMNRSVHLVDGSHNGPGYMAYTFYLRNNGTETTDYGYTVNILSETLNTAAASWIMFFEDEKQIIYAREQFNGEPENLHGYPTPPFIETAYYPEEQYFERDGLWGIRTTPFIDEYTALQGYVSDFEPGDVKKYTVVVWLEGDDPDCNNSILGGHVGFNITFERLGEDNTDFFKGLFREEYDKSFLGEEPDGPDTSYGGTGERGDETVPGAGH